MARRPGKTYSRPKGYKASLTGPASSGRDRRRANRWGAFSSSSTSAFKPAPGTPRFQDYSPTETKEDLAERDKAVGKLFGSASNEFGDSVSAGQPSGSAMAEVLSAVASHGTVEASPRGEYSGRTVQAPSTGRKLGESGLTDAQKSGVERSVASEIDSRLEAKRTGSAYTGARSAEEQRRQNIDYQNDMVRRFGEEKAKERLGDRWVEPPSTGLAVQPDGPVTREFAPGVGGYTVSPRPVSSEGKLAQPAAEPPTRPAGRSEVDKAIADAEALVADLNKKYGDSQDSAAPSSTSLDDEKADDAAEDEFGPRSDAKGGRTSAPAGQAPAPAAPSPGPEEPQLVFGSRGEAAAALMARGAEMDYPTFAQAAAVASLPGPEDGPDYDPDTSFSELVTGRISDELLSLAGKIEAYSREYEDAYHASNAAAVAMAAGVSPEVYAAATPAERLYLQEKFMDSF